MASHDNSYKQLFSFPRVVKDFLKGYVDEPWVADLDFASLERMSGSYVTDDLRDREDDVIWRVRFGEEVIYLYLLLEFQRTDDPWMAVRILTYVGLLYQDLIKTGAVSRRDRLPLVFPAVIYNGDQPWRSALEVGELIEPMPAALTRYCPHQRYFLLDEQATEARVEGNVVSDILALESWPSVDEFEAVIAGLRRQLAADENRELRRALTVWLRRLVLPKLVGAEQLPPLEALEDLEEVASMLTKKRMTWPERWKEEGMAKGRQEGEHETAVRILSRLLARRFGVAAAEAAKPSLEAADLDQLLIWSERVLTAESVEDVFH